MVSTEDTGKRLDRFLAEQLPDTSRARIQDWIHAGRVMLNQTPAKASARLRGGEQLSVDPAPAQPLRAYPEEIPLDILYEDDDLAAINKPAGLTVHAGAGVKSGTLVNALLHHFGRLSNQGDDLRPGLVHRLDRMTSGVLLVAKNDLAHRRLAEQFQARQVRKTYWALVHGNPAKQRRGGRVVVVEKQRWTRLEMPIGRDTRRRTRMAPRPAGRAAQTDFRVLRELGKYTLLEVRIATGRTHQIRVHLAAIGHPVVGDRLYGAPAADPNLPKLGRFLLHAKEIQFLHPSTGADVQIEAPLPAEFSSLLEPLSV